MFDIITFGSATIDIFAFTDKSFLKSRNYIFPIGSKITIEDLQIHTGGGATNAAVCLSRLEFKVACISKTGSRHEAHRIFKVLETDKVTPLIVAKGKTAYSIIIDAKGHDRTILVFKGSINDLAAKEISFKKIKTKWLYFSAMIGKSLRTQFDLTEYARKRKINICYNPSNYVIKTNKKVVKHIIRHSRIVSLNDSEARLLMGNYRIKQTAKKIKALGPEIVLITQGSKGALAYDGRHFYNTKPHNIKAVESTGAGDCFASTFLAGYIKTKNIETSLKYAQTNVESVIRYVGAKNGLFHHNQLLKKLRSNPVKIIKTKK